MKLSNFIISLITACLAITLEFSGLLNFAELKTLDLRFQLRSQIPQYADKIPQQSDEIIIIGIDDDTIYQTEEPFILWDTFFAEVIEKLARYQANVIGLDLIWSKSIDNFVERSKDKQNALKKALLTARYKYKTPVVMAIGGLEKESKKTAKEKDSSIPLQRFGFIIGRSHFGVINIYPDIDTYVRRVKLSFQSVDKTKEDLPGFDALIAKFYLKAPVQYKNNEMLINYQPGMSIPVVSFIDVLQEARNNNQKYFEQHFKNKIVLVGFTSVAEDILPSPLGKETSGILIHAHTIDTFIHNNYLQHINFIYFSIIVLLLALLVGFISSRQHFLKTLLLSSGLMFVYLIINLGLFANNIIIPIITPLLAIIITFGISFFYRFTVEEKSKRRLARFFKSYVNDQVVENILHSNKPIDLKGKKEKVCILFADIRSFTSFSEHRTPEEIVSTLNEYFSAMTDVILDNKGTLDKFIGDGIMAFFGAPLILDNPTVNAAKAALEMREKLVALNVKWKKEGRPTLDNGIGLHTGYALIGNIGSPRKMDYTAIGDSVNLASRIEGLTKQLEAPVLISEHAFLEIQEISTVNPKGSVPVKGRSDISVYELNDIREKTHE